MKTINLKDIEIIEIAWRGDEPNSPVQVTYNIRDEEGNVMMRKNKAIQRADLPKSILNSFVKLSTTLIAQLEQEEL